MTTALEGVVFDLRKIFWLTYSIVCLSCKVFEVELYLHLKLSECNCLIPSKHFKRSPQLQRLASEATV